MKPLLIILSLIMICAVPVSSIAKSKNELPEYTVEGLKRIPDTKDIAVVYAEPGATLEWQMGPDTFSRLGPLAVFNQSVGTGRRCHAPIQLV